MAAFDIRVFLYLHHALAPFLVAAAVLSAIGGGWGALVVVPMFASVRHRLMARALAYVLTLDAVTVFGLKKLVARVRPCGCLPEIHALMFGMPTDYSFPSGHAAGSFAFAVFFAVVLVRGEKTSVARRAGAMGLVLLALGVGLSRIALGVHFPGDVLAGAILGSTIGGVGASLYLRAWHGRLARARVIPIVPDSA